MQVEVLLNAFVHIGLSIVLFIHIDRKCYPAKRTKLFFLIPLWSMFLGFYYLRCWIDGQYFNQYWRSFRIFETMTNALFLAFFIYKNYNLKKYEKK